MNHFLYELLGFSVFLIARAVSPGSTLNNGGGHNKCNNAALLSNYKENFLLGAQSTLQTLSHS